MGILNQKKQKTIRPAPLTPNNISQMFSVRQWAVQEAMEEALTTETFQAYLEERVLPLIPGYDPGSFTAEETEHWESLMTALLNSSIDWILRNVEK